MRGYNIDNYIGKKFNKLTLIKNLNKIDKNNSKMALFKCDCGNVKEMVFTQVLRGDIKSCGCNVRGNLSNLINETSREKRILFNMQNTQKNNKTGYTRNFTSRK